MPRILIVDDLEDNRNLLRQLLEDDYGIDEAVNGRQALEAIARHRPDLVILDLMMPEMDGFEVLRRLQDQQGPFLPVVVVTAMAEREARMRALTLGAHEFLTKPLDYEELGVRIRTMMMLKEARDSVERRADDLEDRVAQRTRELAERNAELQQANEELQLADRYKDEFLSVISHELRTPLNFIMSFASVLEDEVAGPLNQQQQGFVDKILHGSDRMLRLVNNLLDMSRMQAGKFQLHPAETNFNGIVQDVLTTMQPAAEAKDARLEAEVEVPALLMVDGLRLVQVLTNLVDNAIKFSPPGSTVRLSAFLEEDALVCEVADSGIGIAREDIPRLFNRFTQLDMSSTRAAGGTGLGLSICRSIVEAHGGRIEVDSAPDEGSVFRIRLPLVRLPANV